MSKGKRFFLIALALAGMFLSSVACDDTGDDTNDLPDIGEATLDEMAEDTVDTIETGVSMLCKACTLANGDDSDSCTGVCD